VSPGRIAILAAVALATAIVGVITGGNSLVTVPVMIMVGFEPRAAVATNMFALCFMTLAATVRFARERYETRGVTVPLAIITGVTSAAGAALTVALPERAVKTMIAVSLGVMILFLAARPNFGAAPAEVTPARRAVGWALATVLGVYGGLYSGGYTTLLTFVCVALFGVPLLGAVGLTKLVNFVSCVAATIVFFRAGAVELRTGLAMGAAMAAGGYIGAALAIKRGHGFVRVMFLVTVALLTIKVVYDLAR
jgi:uncharacterized protein